MKTIAELLEKEKIQEKRLEQAKQKRLSAEKKEHKRKTYIVSDAILKAESTENFKNISVYDLLDKYVLKEKDRSVLNLRPLDKSIDTAESSKMT